VHLHACATDGAFVPAADHAGCEARPTLLPDRPIIPCDLAALTERVRRRVIRWFRMQRLLDAAAAADMLAWENSGVSVDASVRITLIDRDVPSYFQSLEHLLQYCARPPFALERLSVIRGPDGRISRAMLAEVPLTGLSLAAPPAACAGMTCHRRLRCVRKTRRHVAERWLTGAGGKHLNRVTTGIVAVGLFR